MKLFEVARDIHRNLTRKVGYECGKAGRDYRCPLAVRYRPLRANPREVGGFHAPGNHTAETALAGWGARIRTWEWRNQIPQFGLFQQCHSEKTRDSGLFPINRLDGSSEWCALLARTAWCILLHRRFRRSHIVGLFDCECQCSHLVPRRGR